MKQCRSEMEIYTNFHNWIGLKSLLFVRHDTCSTGFPGTHMSGSCYTSVGSNAKLDIQIFDKNV